ncbi:MAG: glycerophosphodiester phosphodiesterase family protein, partial [Methanobacteriota archaeon]
RLKRRLPGIATYMTSRAVVRFLFPAMFSQEFRHDAFAVPPTLRGIPLVRPAFVRRGHALGLPVHVWTINRPEAMRAFFSMDVNGIVTDRVRAAVEVAGALRV